MEKMSITRALVEKKRLEERINREIRDFNPVCVVVGNSVPTGFQTIQDYNEKVKSDFNSIKDICARREHIVQAIAMSNAVTKVTINGIEMTVAQAIEKKNFYRSTMISAVENLKRKWLSTENFFNQTEESEKNKANQEFERFIGRDKQLKEEETTQTRKIIDDRHKVTFLNPIDLQKIIDKKDKEIHDFLSDVDIALTESNSKTEIEI